MREEAPTIPAPSDEPNAVVERLFVRAAQRVGGASALVARLGLTYSEVRSYLGGEAIPPRELLWQVVELVGEDLELVKTGLPDRAWESLLLGGSPAV